MSPYLLTHQSRTPNFSHKYILISLNKNLIEATKYKKVQNWFDVDFFSLSQCFKFIHEISLLFIARYFLALITSENCRVCSKLFLRFHAASSFLAKNSRIEIYCHFAESFTVSSQENARTLYRRSFVNLDLVIGR